MPAFYGVDSSRFGHWVLTGPGLPGGRIDNTQDPQDGVLNPTGAWFHNFRVQSTGLTLGDATGAVIWQVRGYYGAVEIPWWSLLLLFSPPPALWLLARRRIRSRRRDGLCPACGYDLRATPDACPECGQTARRLPV